MEEVQSWRERLRLYREKAGLSRDELAARVNERTRGKLRGQALYRWESAEVTPGVDVLAVVADLLGVTVDDIMHGSEPEAVLAEFLRTHKVTPEERERLESVRWRRGEPPSADDYAALLDSYRRRTQSAESSEVTAKAREAALKRGGRPLAKKRR
jgi:transcriptional regulator with XRE-family HTH domain